MWRDVAWFAALHGLAACAVDDGVPHLTPSVVAVTEDARRFRIDGLAPPAYLDSDRGVVAMRDGFAAVIGDALAVVLGAGVDGIDVEIAAPLPVGVYPLSVETDEASWLVGDALEVVAGDSASCPAAPAGCVPFSCGPPACHYLCQAGARAVAVTTCGSFGAHVVTIGDAGEDACLSVFLTARGQDRAWIGLGANVASSDGWAWDLPDGTSYRNWAASEPRVEPEHECVCTTPDGWTTGPCSASRPFVCER
jgi:hypothetical protein